MNSDPGDYVGQGMQRLFGPAGGQVTVHGTRDALTVDVSGGVTGEQFSIGLAAPPGKSLGRHVYDKAQRTPFRVAGRPGIDIEGEGRGCNQIEGRFEVKDIAFDTHGTVRRLWVVFEQHCEGAMPALFGEARFHEPVRGSPATTAPAILRWPEGDRGRSGTVVPVAVIASGAVRMRRASLVGTDRAHFRIRLDECAGKRLSAGDACLVWVRFTRKSPGTHAATLRLADAAGHRYSAALQGFAFGGTTRVTMHSESGDFIGAGRDWSFTPRDSIIGAGGTREHVGFAVNGSTIWYADFDAANGNILAPGHYSGAARYPFNGSSNGLAVYGDGRGCNTLTGSFTVTDARFEPFGKLRGFGARFEQHCEGASPALRGTFDFRAGDRTRSAPWMLPGSRTVGPPARINRG